ncbi:hypothetical protein HGRIS_013466 [Hohenbuehelia grisea]|uniref:Uncharacterized protein n=1 Tax=Hohenbuehelia grisea TaxID=104357 RepID=A0ABR3IVT6_9AGAR
MSLRSVLENTLWSSTPRVYLLRTLLVSSIVCLVTAPLIMQSNGALIPILCLSTGIIVHHSLSIFHWRILLELVHWVLLTAEIVAWFLSFNFKEYVIDRWATQKFIIGVSVLYIQLVALLILWVILTTQILANRGAHLTSPYQFLSLSALILRKHSTIQKALSIYLGRTMLKISAIGEHRVVVTVRAICALAILAGLAAFAVVSIVIDPVRETGLVPSKSYHTTDLVYDFNMAPPVWSIIAYIDASLPIARQTENFKQAVRVTPLWDDAPHYPKPTCVHLPGSRAFGGEVDAVASEPYIQTITVFCPSRLKDTKTIQQLMTTASRLISPDLLITVNFTMLNIDQTSLSDERMRVVSILVGLTNNTADVIANTLPTPLSAGSHLYGSVSREFRTRYDRASSAAWGIFTSSHTFLIGSILSLLPDPSPLSRRFSEWLMEEDIREKSVWAGLAAIGGFWTFMNGVFVYIFGSGLLWVIFGVKPLSIFGLSHRLQGDHGRQAWLQRFPRLGSDDKDPEPGLVDFMREHIVDLGPLEEKSVAI